MDIWLFWRNSYYIGGYMNIALRDDSSPMHFDTFNWDSLSPSTLKSRQCSSDIKSNCELVALDRFDWATSTLTKLALFIGVTVKKTLSGHQVQSYRLMRAKRATGMTVTSMWRSDSGFGTGTREYESITCAVSVRNITLAVKSCWKALFIFGETNSMESEKIVNIHDPLFMKC